MVLEATLLSRRSVLESAFLWGVVSSVHSSAVAANDDDDDDALDRFGEALSNGRRWPESPSPLPTSFGSAAELTAPRDIDRPDQQQQQEQQQQEGVTDLQNAIKLSKRKKQIGPLTHAAYEKK
eukprot:CAMPEP_0116562738 /NCGR_PEP_ID=MMETSP0397-20121206/12336_1 /TAXON_ID=216820 /ORGANISM="Cyclophora tenuis, Strain ECT3854" /LENGTH=122 /DNA_ID=CAMNT_0004089087 /DNA_START=125 /DNA_END=493 /DNA_ORIENTATION=-